MVNMPHVLMPLLYCIPALSKFNIIDLDQHQLEYHGYGLSEDCTSVTKNNQNVLYLTQDFRPGYPAKYSTFDSVAFMDSTVAIQNQSGHIQILRFHDNDVRIKDSRWIKK